MNDWSMAAGLSQPLASYKNISTADDLFDFTANTSASATEWRHPTLAALLGLLCFGTIFGNTLVVIAVATKKYLHNPTGYLIVSLAFADLLVGAIVMPLNSVYEVANHKWLFGLPMCDFFHSVDILASTASIWNLCVISLDRYISNRDPIGYRDKVSIRRIAIAIICVWLVSAALSFPAIIWWRVFSPDLYTAEYEYQCVFTDDIFYVAFSSFVSFYIPLAIILYAYGHVFLIATKHSRSLKEGRKQVKNNSPRHSKDAVHGLRMHRGNASNVPARGLQNSFVVERRKDRRRQLHKQESTVSLLERKEVVNGRAKNLLQVPSMESLPKVSNGSLPAPSGPFRDHSSSLGKKQSLILPPVTCRPAVIVSETTNGIDCEADSDPNVSLRPLRNSTRDSKHLSVRRTSSLITISTTEHTSTNGDLSSSGRERASTRFRRVMMSPLKRLRHNASPSSSGSTMKEKSSQLIRYFQEQRAARTLGIVVGCFVACWTPFFVFHVLCVACGTEPGHGCLANVDIDLVFTVLTWLGHANSMLNPIIYSRFSREFRRAFRQLLQCRNDRQVKSALQQQLHLVFAQTMSLTAAMQPPGGLTSQLSVRERAMLVPNDHSAPARLPVECDDTPVRAASTDIGRESRSLLDIRRAASLEKGGERLKIASSLEEVDTDVDLVMEVQLDDKTIVEEDDSCQLDQDSDGAAQGQGINLYHL